MRVWASRVARLVLLLVLAFGLRVARAQKCRYQPISENDIGASPQLVSIKQPDGAACALCAGEVKCGGATRIVVCPATEGRCPTANECAQQQIESAARLKVEKARAPREESHGSGWRGTAGEYRDGPLLVTLDACAPICVGYVEDSSDEGSKPKIKSRYRPPK